MAILTIRFDFRNPAFAGTTMHERYQAGLDMVQWADERGFVACTLSEHHAVEDGYLPSALTMAAAMAARSKNMRLMIAAIVPAMHDPVRLAEDVAVVDQISGGRLDLTVTNGYVPGEFAMFGHRVNERVRLLTEAVSVLRRSYEGEPFDHNGRPVLVRPQPYQKGGPKISLGGSTEAAARRAARIGDGFIPSTPALWEFYRDELMGQGKPDPGPHPGGDTSFFHLAEDVDAGWEAIAPFALHETNAYGRWMADAGVGETGGFKPATDADALRATGQYRVLTPGQLLEELTAKGPYALCTFHPLMGGIPPELGWRSLRLFEEKVLPHL